MNLVNVNHLPISYPNIATSIDDHAFYNCKSLTSIIISNSITTIGECVFYNCKSLTSITIPNSVLQFHYV